MLKQRMFLLSGVLLIGFFVFLSVPASGVSFREIGPRGNLSGTIAVSQSFPRLIVHLDEAMVNVSHDAGDSWESFACPQDATYGDILASPWDRPELFLWNSGKIYFCDGMQGDWEDRTPSEYHPESYSDAYLNADTDNPGRLVVFFSDQMKTPRLLETLDRGVSWHVIPGPPGYFQAKGLAIPDPSGQSLFIQIEEKDSFRTYIGVTDDLGTHWNLDAVPHQGYSPSGYSLADDRSIWLFAGTIYRREWDGGEWQHVPCPIAVNDLAFLTPTSDSILVKNADRLYGTNDSGQTWTELHRFRHSTGDMLYTSEQLLICSEQALLKSTDTGLNFASCYSGSRPAWVNHISVDPHLPGRLYASTRSYLWISSDDGDSWTLSDTFPPDGQSLVFPDSDEPGRLYACAQEDGIISSRDYGNTWQLYNENCSARSLSNYTFTPDTNEVIVLSSRTGYRRSTGDSAWIRIDNSSWDYAAELITIHPEQPSLWHVFTSYSGCGSSFETIYRSTDGGVIWHEVAMSYRFLAAFAPIPGNPDLVIGSGTDENYDYRLIVWDLNTLEMSYREKGGASELMFLSSQPDQYIYFNGNTHGIFRSSPHALFGTVIASAEDLYISAFTIDPANPDRILCAGNSVYELLLTDHIAPDRPSIRSIVPRYQSVDVQVSMPSDAAGVKVYQGLATETYDTCLSFDRDNMTDGWVSFPADHLSRSRFRISCYDGDGNESDWTEESSVIVDSLTQNKPQILLAGFLDTRIEQSGDQILKIGVIALDPQGLSDEVEVWILSDNDLPQYVLHDDGTGDDTAAGDGFYLGFFDHNDVGFNNGMIRFQAVDRNGDRSDIWPRFPVKGESR